jgi:hypothetical protein
MDRHYYLYLIEDEFASHYFGRESVIYQLFRDYHWTNLTREEYILISKQVDYITKPIPLHFMHKRLNVELCEFDYVQINSLYRAVLPHGKGCATFMMKERHIEVLASGDFEAETIFFEILRKINPCFLAMDFRTRRYGWLNPVKEENLSKKQEIYGGNVV